MNSLRELVALNERAAARFVARRNRVAHRDSSFLQSRGGVVLHSATQRSTGWLEGSDAREFLELVGKLDNQPAINRLIESYF